MCLWRIDDLANALLTYKQILQIDPRDESALTNCLELMLLQKDFDGFEDLLSKNLQKIKAKNEGWLIRYLQTLELYQRASYDKFMSMVRELAQSAPAEASKLLG